MPIFDQGYQHWKGALSGRGWRWLVIARHGLRGQMKNRIVRFLILFAWVPALVLVVAMALWGLFEQGTEGVQHLLRAVLPPGLIADPHVYRQAVWTLAYSIFFKFELFFVMLLVLAAGPNLISQDLRFNALPLYFSRPLTRWDYFLGKLGVIGALAAAVTVVPAAIAYLLGICFSLDLSVIRDTWRLWPASILYGLIMAVSAGTLMLALSSLSRRSLYVGMCWVGIWVIGSTVMGALTSMHREALFETMVGHERSEPNRMTPQRRQQWRSLQERIDQAEADAAASNWRPLFSYTANLERLGEALLNTDAAWVQLGRAMEVPRAALGSLLGSGGRTAGRSPANNERRLANQFVPQYPWIWSAGVLAGLWGLSLWILSMRVKSLDQLR
jgi:ABC-2 type transport system permease protein